MLWAAGSGGIMRLVLKRAHAIACVSLACPAGSRVGKVIGDHIPPSKLFHEMRLAAKAAKGQPEQPLQQIVTKVCPGGRAHTGLCIVCFQQKYREARGGVSSSGCLLGSVIILTFS